ncbi:type I 3-dehydroquinate dehydratase, partial [Candidatus Peregrinibacteria bacterium]|nr:type I 3-dehydroquinate dehydratase [Candidatus Peregrinibacteria bacterium]
MKICIPIREKSLFQAQKQVKRALRKTSKMTGIYFEIWLDFLEKSDFKALFKAAKKPVIAVCRSQAEKGSFFGFEAERVALLQKAAESGASYIDIGAQTAPSFIRRIVETCRKNSAVLIISSHIWDKTPPLSELLALDARLRKMGAD